MARIFVTGSADGLGRGAAQSLLDDGHEVVVHARGAERLAAVEPLIAQGASAPVGDLAGLDLTRAVADQVNRRGRADAVIHNAGVIRGPQVLPVNVVAPYLLTALIDRPRRLVYLSSDMHHGGRPDLTGLDWSGRRATSSYSDSKLLVTALAMVVARLWPDVSSNAVDPGWVPTRMGGPGASDDLRLGHLPGRSARRLDSLHRCATRLRRIRGTPDDSDQAWSSFHSMKSVAGSRGRTWASARSRSSASSDPSIAAPTSAATSGPGGASRAVLHPARGDHQRAWLWPHKTAAEWLAPEDVAGDWYDTTYRAGLDAVRRAVLPELYDSWNPTDADLFLWVYELRRDLRAHDPTLADDAASRARRKGTRAFETADPARRQPAVTATGSEAPRELLACPSSS